MSFYPETYGPKIHTSTHFSDFKHNIRLRENPPAANCFPNETPRVPKIAETQGSYFSVRFSAAHCSTR